MTCQYVYILVDIATGTHFYTGCTEDLNARLRRHNAGEVLNSSLPIVYSLYRLSRVA